MNRKRTISYVGVTDNLKRSCIEHKAGKNNAYTRRNLIKDLVYFEHLDTYEEGIVREKHLKLVSHTKRLNMVLRSNPNLADMAANWYSVSQIECYEKGNMV